MSRPHKQTSDWGISIHLLNREPSNRRIHARKTIGITCRRTVLAHIFNDYVCPGQVSVPYKPPKYNSFAQSGAKQALHICKENDWNHGWRMGFAHIFNDYMDPDQV
jgi:hypothetical protein